MCGRYTLVKLIELSEIFPWISPPTDAPPPRYNIAPGQPVPAVANDDRSRLRMFHWGLIPSWAKDRDIGTRLINARAETLAEKPSFRTALRRRRCLLPADGFYEWRKEPDGTKTPMLVTLKSGKPFAFAGLWDLWPSPEGDPVQSCTIVTTEPNELVAPIHNRMPVILPPSAYDLWLDPAERPPAQLAPLLRPYPAAEMDAWEVSRLVNNPRNDVPQCVDRAGTK